MGPGATAASWIPEVDMNRCIDPTIGVKVLSYDLLEGAERQEMDAHMQVCAACRDFRQQTFGKEGALDELAYRAFRLSQRRRVEPGAWFLERLRDLWMPLFVLLGLLLAVGVYVGSRGPETDSVGVRRLAVSRGSTLDSTSSVVAPRVDVHPEAVIVRPDRPARVYVYEAREGSLRRLVPPDDVAPPQLSPDAAREIFLPRLEAPESRVLLVLVPEAAGGDNAAWDAAVFRRLGGRQAGDAVAGGEWPGGVQPTLRWLP
jgi:hypothetical protein